MQVFIPPVIVNANGDTIIDYTNGAHMFFLHHNVQYRTQYDSMIVVQPLDGIEIEVDTIEDLVKLAEQYEATITITPNGLFEIEFVE